MENIKIIEKLPSISKYIELRKEVGWATVDIETAKRGIIIQFIVYVLNVR